MSYKYRYDRYGTTYDNIGLKRKRAEGIAAGTRADKYLARIPAGTAKGLGAIIGAGIGARYGGKVGATMGAGAGAFVGSGVAAVTGYGDYTGITGSRMSVPRVFNRSGRNGVCIRHEEYLGDIVTSSTIGAFSLQAFPINAGQGITFPWLEQIAVNFEEYILQGCLFTFKSMSADALNSTNTALGTVIMATDYNAGNPVFASKAEMESYEFASSCKPSMSMVHPIECHPHQNPISELYVRPGALPAGQDIRLYDLGLFQIATTGFQAASVNIGELWISYQVCLLKPKMWQALGYNNGYWHMYNTTGVAAATPLGTAANQVVASSSNLSVSTTATVITLPATSYPQTYIIMFYWQGTAAAVAFPALTFANCGTRNFYPVPASSFVEQAPQSTLAGTTQFLVTECIQTTGLYTTPTITFGGGGVLPGGALVDIKIIQTTNIIN